MRLRRIVEHKDFRPSAFFSPLSVAYLDLVPGHGNVLSSVLVVVHA